MNNVYTHNYMSNYEANEHMGIDSIDYYVELFEQDAAAHLQHCTANDVGGVVLYMDNNDNEVAFFDYENLVGAVHTMGSTTAQFDYCA